MSQPSEKTSLNLLLLTDELTRSGASESTSKLYLSIARRFEQFAEESGYGEQLVTGDGPAISEAIAAWSRTTAATSHATLKTYRSALSAYFRAAEMIGEVPKLEAEGVVSNLTAASFVEELGRKRPSAPLTDRELLTLRKHSSVGASWVLAGVELALAGLTAAEISKTKVGNYRAGYVGHPEIVFGERSIPIFDLESAELMVRRSVFPGSAGREGEGVSMTLIKRVIARLVRLSRSKGTGHDPDFTRRYEGLRTLANTGATRAIRMGEDPEKVAAAYRRSSVPDEWKSLVPKRVVLGRGQSSRPVSDPAVGDPARGAAAVQLSDEEFDFKYRTG